MRNWLVCDHGGGALGASGHRADSLLGKLLEGDTRLQMVKLVEHPARVLAWMSQIRARLWVRNGEELFRLERIYRSNFWHEYSLDLDIFLLQIGTAVSGNPDRTLSRILQIFQLDQFLEGPETRASQLLAPATEMCLVDAVQLLAVLGRERSLTGNMDQVQLLRRELLNWLCVGDQTHTQLTSSVCPLLTHSPHLDEQLNAVATYTQPKLQGRGRYTLRPECWREFDPFFPHFTRAELQEALHRAHAAKLWHPEWQLDPRTTPPAALMGYQSFLSCEAAASLIRRCLNYALDFRGRQSVPEELAIYALQMLACAQLRQHEPRTQILLHAAPSNGHTVAQLLQEMAELPAAEATIPGEGEAGIGLGSLGLCAQKLMRDFRKSGLVATAPGEEEPASPQPSPGEDEVDAVARAERKRLARERQAAVMAKMSAQQQKFMDQMTDAEDAANRDGAPKEDVGTCSLCRVEGPLCLEPASGVEDLEEGGRLGLVSLVQRSNMPAISTYHAPACTYAHSTETDQLHGLHVQCCGHHMHLDCFHRYTSSLQQSATAERLYEGVQVLDVEGGEFLCPICRRLANAILPVRSAHSHRAPACPDAASPSTLTQLSDHVHAVVREVETACVGAPMPSRHAQVEMQGVHGFLQRSWTLNVPSMLPGWELGLHLPPEIAASTSGMRWAMLAHNIAHYEVTKRPVRSLLHGAASREADASSAEAGPSSSTQMDCSTHWDAMLVLVRLCLVPSSRIDQPLWAATSNPESMLAWLMGKETNTAESSPGGWSRSEANRGQGAEEPGSSVLTAWAELSCSTPDVLSLIEEDDADSTPRARPASGRTQHRAGAPGGEGQSAAEAERPLLVTRVEAWARQSEPESSSGESDTPRPSGLRSGVGKEGGAAPSQVGCRALLDGDLFVLLLELMAAAGAPASSRPPGQPPPERPRDSELIAELC
ncbi:hypothetical protein CYMTET_31597 [Cymbomonas tetramitiformis]|uniref:E3 ubiquitin-protein ligase n=1 Tax=Cymbomonas tetramitiformis TaxID=36881 RepID=A0AAE0FGI6_9CHLO|nr:hypothetical protein CYMTET_31597 [Cymbomonas tetramitiformis]